MPGDKSIHEQVGANNVHNRTITAQVSTVEPNDGFVVVNYSGLPSGGRYITVPPLWMSFPPDNTSVGPAWGRYMPQPTDIMKISFNHDNTPLAVGYDIVANKPDVADGFTGWPELNRLYEEAINNPSVSSDRKKFAQFVPLKPGEYDFMSSGGSYIYGNNRGRLYLAGGPVSISLIKSDLRLNASAQLFSHNADDCEFKFGQVRRASDQSTGIETPTSDKAAREFTVDLNRGQSKLANMSIGNVIDNTGTSIKSKFNNDAVYRLAIFSGDTAAKLEQIIDSMGNIEIKSPNASGGIFLDFSSGKWESKNTEVEMNASSKFSIVSPSVNLGSKNPPEQLVHGTTYIAEAKTWAGNVNTMTGNLTTQLSTTAATAAALSSVIAAAAVPMAIPIVGPIAAAAILAAGAAAAIPAFTAVGPAIAAQQAVFTAQMNLFTSRSYLSNVSRTD